MLASAKKAGIWDQMALFVVSDHGFTRQEKVARPGVLLREKGLVTVAEEGGKTRITGWNAQVLSASGSASIYVKEKDDQETRRILLELFQPLAGKPGSGIARIFTQQQIAAMGGDPQAFLALEPAVGFGFAAGVTGDYITKAPSPGIHGLPPDRDEMLSSLLVYGPAIAPGKIENARIIDIGPTVAEWLGLRLEKAEGNALAVPLKQQRPQARR